MKNKNILTNVIYRSLEDCAAMPIKMLQEIYWQIFDQQNIYIYIYIKSKGIYQPENLMSNGSSRLDDATQTK